VHSAQLVYHLTPRSEFLGGIEGEAYSPPRLALDGFVHCATREVTLSVARDYFAGLAEPLLVLGIEPGRLRAELRYEAPAPIAGGGTAHLAEASLFPHVYGPIDLIAISGVGVLARDGDAYVWPARLVSLAGFLRGAGQTT
jgi:uncharacterized protein (DUF952 family)